MNLTCCLICASGGPCHRQAVRNSRVETEIELCLNPPVSPEARFALVTIELHSFAGPINNLPPRRIEFQSIS